MGLKILLAPYVISCQNFSCGARRIFISIEQTKNSLFFVFLLPQKVYLTEDICFCVFFHIFHLLSFLTCRASSSYFFLFFPIFLSILLFFLFFSNFLLFFLFFSHFTYNKQIFVRDLNILSLFKYVVYRVH